LRRPDDPVDWGREAEKRAYSMSVALEDEGRDCARREKGDEVLGREARIPDGYRTNQERWEWEEDHDVERQGAVPNRIWRFAFFVYLHSSSNSSPCLSISYIMERILRCIVILFFK
jgi:hypothetical protein